MCITVGKITIINVLSLAYSMVITGEIYKIK